MGLERKSSYGKRYIVPPSLRKQPEAKPSPKADFNAAASKHKAASEASAKKEPVEAVSAGYSYRLPREEGAAPESETSSIGRKKTFRERQFGRLEYRMLKVLSSSSVQVPGSSSPGFWLRNELEDMPSYILPFLDVGKRKVYSYAGSDTFVTGYRVESRSQPCRGWDQEVKAPIIREGSRYKKEKILALKLRHSWAMKFLAVVTFVWTVAYFAGCPPPQRFFIESQRKELRQYMDSQECFGDANFLHRLRCAEKIYTQTHEY